MVYGWFDCTGDLVWHRTSYDRTCANGFDHAEWGGAAVVGSLEWCLVFRWAPFTTSYSYADRAVGHSGRDLAGISERSLFR